ncbi:MULTISPECIES: DUF2968 domain-containing protein [unclassified Dyella]|uniref:DUF2968 domain-containing protein n=1 Tax=unclassified Dyella TaxID=2634549 RepID=UPI003F91948A
MSETSSMREFSVVFRSDEEDDIATADAHAVHDHDDLAVPELTHGVWPRHYTEGDVVEVADVEEVEALMHLDTVTQVREMHSFNHAVRLLFHNAALKFYAAIYMDDLLWRAMKSSDFDAAEKAFDDFVAQVNHRARSEVRRVQLDAANMQLQRVIAESEARAERLRANIQRNATQKQRAMERESELRDSIQQLDAARLQAQLYANRTFRQIGQLHSTCAALLPRYRGGLPGLRKK